jgi:RNA polymerase-binding transcription factor DksA
MPTSRTAVRVPRSGPLTPAHRMHLRALLHELWCQHLDELTNLSIAARAEQADAGEELDTRLWSLRRALVEIEAAIRRIDTRGYGRCDGCDGWIDTAMLQRRPHRRFCARCEQRAAASGGTA